MKYNKLILTLVLAIFTLVFFVVGCGNDETPETDVPATATPAPTDPADDEDAEETPPAQADYSERVSIEWVVWGDTAHPDFSECEFMLMWEEMFNVDIEMVGLPYDQWTSSLRIWANAGDLPDVAQFSYNHVDGAMWAEQGLVKRMPDTWRASWPNLASAYDRTVIGDVLDATFGGTYFLPRPIFNENQPVYPLVSHQGIYFRRDWLEAVGAPIQPTYTLDEFMEIARAIQEQDPGNLGDRMTVIHNDAGGLAWIFVYPMSTYSMNASEFFKGDDGQFHWGPAQPETLEGLRFFQQAWDEGLLHPEFFAVSGHQDEFIVAGNVGIIQAPGMAVVANRFGNNFREHQDLEPEEWLHFAFIVQQDGVFTGPEAPNFWGALIMNPNIDDVKFERVMDILDFSSTTEGQNIIRMGIPEVDWTFDDDDQLMNLLPEGGNVLDLHTSVRPFWHNLYIVSDDFGLINPAFPQIYRDMAFNAYVERIESASPTSIGRIDWDIWFFDSDARRRATVNLADEYTELILAPGDIEDKWNAWVEERMVTIQPVLDELNAAFGS